MAEAEAGVKLEPDPSRGYGLFEGTDVDFHHFLTSLQSVLIFLGNFHMS